ncbi:MAG: type III secretion system ATPase SctN [Puniceicoccales bacterium]|jgi:type III secretion protein N (ATPase)|nr:type III secretion system ATPase SctN [Puniceicoccales bacterium]
MDIKMDTENLEYKTDGQSTDEILGDIETGKSRSIASIIDQSIEESTTFKFKGKVLQVVGTIMKAAVPSVKIGELCILKNPWEDSELYAEVVGFDKQAAILTPLGELNGISSSTEVIPTGDVHMVPVGDDLMGRTVDGLGHASVDKIRGKFEPEAYYPVYCDPPSPMSRAPIAKPLSLGVRALDGLLTCGEGQRLGIFAAAGGGKSTLLAQIIRNTEAEINVLALIGERGREVREFIEKDLGEEGMKRSILVIATSDRSAMERLKAAYVATAIAEYFRDKNKKVLLMMDSATRFARAQREIGLAAGEPPTRRGFPPSVFATLPKLMERAGQSAKGSITALYTVLVEGDDMTEPVADETRSILDGHIILSRKLGSANHYPAIDVLASISRCMSAIVPDDHKAAAGKLRNILAKYNEVELLVRIGEYKRGSDAVTDEAIDRIEAVNSFLKQGQKEINTFDETVAKLKQVVGM